MDVAQTPFTKAGAFSAVAHNAHRLHRPLPSNTASSQSHSLPEGAKPQKEALFVRLSSGPTTAQHGNNRSIGINIAGHAGDSVVDAARGRAVYAGDQLRGCGKMIIIKHDETFLTVYAHNQTILVTKNDLATQNQKIAEMGQTDNDRVKVHFEFRKNGVAVDPEP